MIKCEASLAFYPFSSTSLINSIKHEHSGKILYVDQGSSVFTSPQSCSAGPALFSLPLAGAVLGRALLVCAPLLGLSDSRVSDILLPVTTFTSGAGGCRKN